MDAEYRLLHHPVCLLPWGEAEDRIAPRNRPSCAFVEPLSPSAAKL